MIMLVSFYTLPCVVNINIVLLKLLQYVYIDGCWIDSDLGTRKFRQSLSLYVEPRMEFNLANRDSFIWVSRQDSSYQVLSFVAEVVWHLKICRQDFLVQVARVWVFKGQVACQ